MLNRYEGTNINLLRDRKLYRIVGQDFNENSHSPIILLEKLGLQKLIKTTPIQITLNKTLLDQLSPQDAHLIGYLTATEQAAIERKMLMDLQQLSIK